MMKVGVITVGFLLTAGLAGCLEGIGIGGEPTGTLAVSVIDDAEGIDFEVDGVFAKKAGNEGGWVQINDGIAHWVLDGDGEMEPISAAAIAQDYDLLQVTFSNVSEAGEFAVLKQGGFIMPIDFAVSDGGETTIQIGFAWSDALFQSTQGLAFQPAINALIVTEDGEETINLQASDIDLGPTKAPVARMRVLDEIWEIWQSDFLAESADQRKKGTAGNLTFLASESEALAPGATLDTFTWTFDDGVVLEGATVNRVYDLNGGNFSVLLTVTDSNGVSDTQNLEFALAPGAESHTTPFLMEGLQGLSPNGECSDGEQIFELEVDPSVTPSGAPAGVASVVTYAVAQAPHPLAKIDLRAFDGEGSAIGAATSGGATAAESERTATKNFDPAGAQPAAGTWVVKVQPCKAYDLTVSGSITINWQGVGDPEFVAWYDIYDDGENR